MKRVTHRMSQNLAYRKCKGNNVEASQQEGKLCNEVERVRKLIYLGNRLSAGGGY